MIKYLSLKVDSRSGDLIVSSIYDAENPDVITQEELAKSGIKKQLLLKGERRSHPEDFGIDYMFKLSEEQIKGLFDFK